MKSTFARQRFWGTALQFAAVLTAVGSLALRLSADDATGKPSPQKSETAETANGSPDSPPPPPVAVKLDAPAAKKPAKRDPNAPTADEQRVLDIVNAERARWGRRPLKINHRLTRVARRHSVNMARWNQMSHYLGGSVGQRIAADGYGVRSSGENIAYGQRGAQSVMSTWMASSGHRNNILSTGYTDIGIGVAYSASGQPYWTQVFATP